MIFYELDLGVMSLGQWRKCIGFVHILEISYNGPHTASTQWKLTQKDWLLADESVNINFTFLAS